MMIPWFTGPAYKSVALVLGSRSKSEVLLNPEGRPGIHVAETASLIASKPEGSEFYRASLKKYVETNSEFILPTGKGANGVHILSEEHIGDIDLRDESLEDWWETIGHHLQKLLDDDITSGTGIDNETLLRTAFELSRKCNIKGKERERSSFDGTRQSVPVYFVRITKPKKSGVFSFVIS
jgi:hypothetical protein